ncbi:DUF881 domain-containing protein [Xylanimonas allomyrinae]|uniref:DUF881 domain-containing protein n=1 Tax=Xylanimonas allomyrinae TaxID=2509459 RepID=A0A4P6EKM1_9MICO|nr:DUF881 domain-containing protein [Xylanimonas allomyrinae]QAY62686.1 DUF881 domain-containing protein [Xylanimonas allomyrinae]
MSVTDGDKQPGKQPDERPDERPDAADGGAAAPAVEPAPAGTPHADDADPEPRDVASDAGVAAAKEADAPDEARDPADEPVAVGPVREPAAPAPESVYRRLGRAMRPNFSRSQLLAGVLCALLGFALVVQVRQSGQDGLSSLRQDDLVRLLDEVTGRAEQLDTEVSRLEASRDELASGSDKAQAALELARQRATSEGILSGRLPAQGPGVMVEIRDPQRQLRASQMFNLLEELRNAGAEVAQVNDVRLVTSSAFVDVSGGIEVDRTPLTPPYRWTVVGDPATLDRALEIPGGALPTIRQAGAIATTTRMDKVTVDATVRLTDPQFARPADPDDS